MYVLLVQVHAKFLNTIEYYIPSILLMINDYVVVLILLLHCILLNKKSKKVLELKS